MSDYPEDFTYRGMVNREDAMSDTPRTFDASERDIHSPFNACLHREFCKSLQSDLTAAQERIKQGDEVIQSLCNDLAAAESALATAKEHLDESIRCNSRIAAERDAAQAALRSGVHCTGHVDYDKTQLESALAQEKEARERDNKDAERGRYMIANAAWHRRNDHDGRYASMVIRLPYEADLSCKATREHAIDAAIAEGK